MVRQLSVRTFGQWNFCVCRSMVVSEMPQNIVGPWLLIKLCSGASECMYLQILKMTEFLAVPLAVLHTSACISAKRICAVRFVFPLAGIHNLLCISSSGNGNQNNYKISACRDAIFSLHFRKRNCRRCIEFPRGGNVNFHVHLRSRGRCTETETKIPTLVFSSQHRNNYKFSACGDVQFWLHSRKWNCRFWIVFPRGGNVNFHVHLRSWGRCTEMITKSPLAGM